MKYLDKVGFALCLIGAGGMAESYGMNRSLAISLLMIIAGGLMIFVGDMTNDAENYRRNNCNNDSNNLDRLFFLWGRK